MKIGEAAAMAVLHVDFLDPVEGLGPVVQTELEEELDWTPEDEEPKANEPLDPKNKPN
jgi:hypothetical protein